MCRHPQLPAVVFHAAQARHLTPAEVRQRWPRLEATCPDCGEFVIAYASPAHFVAGDW